MTGHCGSNSSASFFEVPLSQNDIIPHFLMIIAHSSCESLRWNPYEFQSPYAIISLDPSLDFIDDFWAVECYHVGEKGSNSTVHNGTQLQNLSLATMHHLCPAQVCARLPPL